MDKKNRNFRDVRDTALYDVHAVSGHGQCIRHENKHVNSYCQHGMKDKRLVDLHSVGNVINF